MPVLKRSETMTWVDDQQGHGVEVHWDSQREDEVVVSVDGTGEVLTLDAESMPAVIRALAAALRHLTGKTVDLTKLEVSDA